MSGLEDRAALFKALGHPTRLLIVNLTWDRPRPGDDLARVLNLTPATVSHHLQLLTTAGLLRARRDGQYVLYGPDSTRFSPTLEALVRLEQQYEPDTQSPEPDATDPYARKVLRAFVKQGRLTGIPAQRKKREVILDLLLRDFEPDREYPEAEVNRVLGEWHEDFFTLRRELIITGRMTRERGVYRRAPQPANTDGPLDDLPVRSHTREP